MIMSNICQTFGFCRSNRRACEVLSTQLALRPKMLGMLHYLCYITSMARGESGRIVIEVEPETKKRLYASLAMSGSTLKDWFLKKAADYCREAGQPSLFEDVESRSPAKNGLSNDVEKASNSNPPKT